MSFTYMQHGYKITVYFSWKEYQAAKRKRQGGKK
jgi:hypothetical protein